MSKESPLVDMRPALNDTTSRAAHKRQVIIIEVELSVNIINVITFNKMNNHYFSLNLGKIFYCKLIFYVF